MISTVQSAIQNAHEILPGLWLGNRGASLDAKFLERERIQSVFNCTKDLEFSMAPTVQRRYRIPVDDNLEPEEIRNLELWAPELSYKILHEWKQGPTLVHCFAGMQRSAASVAMVLIVKYRLKPKEAIQFIQSKRPIAFRPSANFAAAIEGFYKYCETTLWPKAS